MAGPGFEPAGGPVTPPPVAVPKAKQSFAGMMAAIVALEREVAKAVKEAKESDEPRVYEWRPPGVPELPCIYNWIADGSYEVVDTARGDDLVVVTATIGVKPSDIAESAGQLMRLTDIFRSVVDPALNQNGPLERSVRYAKRVITRTHIEDFDGVYVMCMEMLIRCELTASIG
jgi:hypothetical protein